MICSVAIENALLGVSRVKGDLGRLDLGNDMEGSVVGANAIGDGKLATSSGKMHGESSIAGGNEDGAFRSVPGWSQILAFTEVSKEADDFGLIALSWITLGKLATLKVCCFKSVLTPLVD